MLGAFPSFFTKKMWTVCQYRSCHLKKYKQERNPVQLYIHSVTAVTMKRFSKLNSSPSTHTEINSLCCIRSDLLRESFIAFKLPRFCKCLQLEDNPIYIEFLEIFQDSSQLRIKPSENMNKGKSSASDN